MIQTNQFLRFFQDDHGNNSLMRLMFVFLMVNAVAMGYFVLVWMRDVPGAIAILSSTSGIATGLKLFQKQQENAIYKKNGTAASK